MGVEPRGIEPPYPSANHGILTVRWPQGLHGEDCSSLENKKKIRDFSRTFEDSIESVVSYLNIAYL